ncbi:Na H Exchanger, cNMP binding, and/or Ion trans domain containing protein [Asbolus verrucosus]|uniref:Na H Exchanger, cNMP binding, and/or Ion trans domain containing protein n=1 Tax=Asbolus verrucosus TaxID=1661398 RepID=A0A482VJ84_ASBVE|nr:Na H Exchanger, cNMP binding, and/or Ion trans domain containing protein [Asbolus verrucosus]
MFLFTTLLTVCAFQAIMNHFGIVSVTYNIFLIIGSFIWGTLVRHYELIENYTSVLVVPPSDLLILYLPVMIFKTALSLDLQTFYRCLPQILIISLPVFFLTALITGSVMRYILGPWDFATGLLFGALCCPTYPYIVVRLLKSVVAPTQHVEVLLDGESMFSIAFVMMINKIIMRYLMGEMSKWHEFVLRVLRFVAIGVASGYVVGLIGRILIRKMYHEPFSILAMIFGVPYLAYCTVEYIFKGSGAISVLMIGVVMAQERAILAKKHDRYLIEFWKLLTVVMDVVTTTYCGVVTAAYVYPQMKWQQMLLVVVTYFMYYFVRFFSFLIFFSISGRLGFGITLKNLFVCVWGGAKNSFGPILIAMDYHYLEMPYEVAQIFFFHIVILYFISFLINTNFSSLLLKILGLKEISMERQISMNNCMKHIFAKRNRAIATLKMDRFLADTNWHMVNVATAMQHPYRTKMKNEREDEDDFFLGYRFTECPDCKQQLVGEPNPKEMREMMKEAKMRILKTKKMSYSRQFENGMLSKEGVRILTQSVEAAMDTEAAVMELEGLHKKFNQEGCCSRFLRNRVQNLSENKKQTVRPPRKQFRRFCFYVVTNSKFEIGMYVVIVAHLIPICVDVYFHVMNHSEEFEVISVALNTMFYLIYCLEFAMKILAYSWIFICKHGFGTYFRSFWNIFNFIILWGNTADLILEYYHLFAPRDEKALPSLWEMHVVLEILRLCRIIKILRVVEILYPKIIKRLDTSANMRLTGIYELAKTYVTGEEEVLELLPFIIDHRKIREEMKRKIEEDRLMVLKLLGLLQKDRPWIAITVKTKQAIRTILNSMREAINQLKTAGWVDESEQIKLMKSMEELYKKVNSIKAVHCFFQGLLMLSYTPTEAILENLEEYGRLPIVDYISSSQFQENVVDYIVSGNCVGELSTLTNRPYNSKISAVTHTQVYVLSNAAIKEAMGLNPDRVNGLECRIWKAESIRIAVPLLLSIPTYQTLRNDQIKYALEPAFMPNLSNYKIFAVTDKIQDILLIEGVVADLNTRDIFTAPSYIPRTVQKLILPTSSLMNIPIDVEAKLLIIPGQNVSQMEIMRVSEEYCQMVRWFGGWAEY